MESATSQLYCRLRWSRLYEPIEHQAPSTTMLFACSMVGRYACRESGRVRVPPRQAVRARVAPGIEEVPAQVGDHRPVDADVDVVPGLAAPVARRVVVADVESAGERHVLVHDEDLPVIAD